MQWFQVTCPTCTAQLQVRLPEGITSVQCSQCKAVFAVQVQPVALSSAGSQVPAKRSRKRKSGDKVALSGGGASSAEAPRLLSAYNVFMKGEVAKVKGEHPDLPHREAFKLAAERWQASPMNPQNGGERFPQKATGDDAQLFEGEAGDGADDGGEDGGDDGGDDGEEDGEEDEDDAAAGADAIGTNGEAAEAGSEPANGDAAGAAGGGGDDGQ